jgi:hypothetical protein
LAADVYSLDQEFVRISSHLLRRNWGRSMIAIAVDRDGAKQDLLTGQRNCDALTPSRSLG